MAVEIWLRNISDTNRCILYKVQTLKSTKRQQGFLSSANAAKRLPNAVLKIRGPYCEDYNMTPMIMVFPATVVWISNVSISRIWFDYKASENCFIQK